MTEGFAQMDGDAVVEAMILAVRDSAETLSALDGRVGDGDHGINMRKGFDLCAGELEERSLGLSRSLSTLSRVLMTKIGGSMGPLYGVFFKAMAGACAGLERVDALAFSAMLAAGEKAVREIGGAEVGDKTMLDTLSPARSAYEGALSRGVGFREALTIMAVAAEAGRDSTSDLVARKGRASRLGERSRGFVDPGAASCCLLLKAMAESISGLL